MMSVAAIFDSRLPGSARAAFKFVALIALVLVPGDEGIACFIVWTSLRHVLLTRFMHLQ